MFLSENFSLNDRKIDILSMSFFFFFLTYLFISIFALSDKFPNILELGIHKNSQICKRRKSRHKQLAYINSRNCNSFILFRKKIQDEAIKYIYI